MATLYVGIDPGERGAGAIIFNGQVTVWDLPEDFGYDFVGKELFTSTYPVVIALENPIPVPKQGVHSLKTFWSKHGFIRGFLAAKNINVQLVDPRVWKRRVFFNTPESKKFAQLNKNASRALASRLYPNVDLGKRKTNDRADALLIARFASLTF